MDRNHMIPEELKEFIRWTIDRSLTLSYVHGLLSLKRTLQQNIEDLDKETLTQNP